MKDRKIHQVSFQTSFQNSVKAEKITKSSNTGSLRFTTINHDIINQGIPVTGSDFMTDFCTGYIIGHNMVTWLLNTATGHKGAVLQWGKSALNSWPLGCMQLLEFRNQAISSCFEWGGGIRCDFKRSLSEDYLYIVLILFYNRHLVLKPFDWILNVNVTVFIAPQILHYWTGLIYRK